MVCLDSFLNGLKEGIDWVKIPLDEDDMLQAERDINNPSIVELVLARLQTLVEFPAEFYEIKYEIQRKTVEGKQILERQMIYLRAVSDMFFIEISD